MAQEPGARASLTQRAVGWALRKAAAYAGQALSLTDASGWRPLLGGSTSSGRAVNDTTAMQVSAVWACIKILAESVGMLPLAVYERQKNGNAEKVDHPLSEILVDSPNGDMTTVEFREAGQVNLGLQGNGYNLVERRGDGNVLSLYPLPAITVVPERNRQTYEIQYRVLERGKWETYPREKIWHLRGFGFNGLIGYSPIGMMRQAMGLSLASEEFGARVFAQGAHTSGVVKIPQWLKDDQRAAAQKNLQDVYAGLENAHKLMLLEGGMEFDANAGMIPPQELQLLELRKFQVHEICRLYRVPPHMVADLERATFSNIEQMSLEFVMFTLLPWLRRWEASADRWLLKPGDRTRFFVRFNFEGLLRADSQARAEYLTKMVANGLMSRNEARAKENLNRSTEAGMDDFTVQSNMVSVDDLSKLVAKMQSNGTAPKDSRPAWLKEAA